MFRQPFGLGKTPAYEVSITYKAIKFEVALINVTRRMFFIYPVNKYKLPVSVCVR